MSTTPSSHWRVVTLACVGLTLVGTGLSLAARSNPKRFTINVEDDRYIQLFAISGFACILIGLLLFLYSVRNTTNAMPMHLQRNVNIRVGFGSILQLAGFFLPEIGPVPYAVGLALIVAGLFVVVWGTMYYAQAKGYSMSLGLLGVIGIPGFIVLILLPQRSVSASVPNESP